jgi:molybdopterin synthase catalytic subunit
MLPHLVDAPLSVSRMIREVLRRSDGALATFVGVVRNENDGLPVETIEYSAYRQMAEREIAAIERELALDFEGTAVRIRHRLGKLAVGDASVAIVAVSPHRREALAACREGIERIKARVPIWKREHGPGRDPAWVDPRHEHAPEGAARDAGDIVGSRGNG